MECAPSGGASAGDHVIPQAHVAARAATHRRVVHGSALDDHGDITHRLLGWAGQGTHRAGVEASEVDVAVLQGDLECGDAQGGAVGQGLPATTGVHLDRTVVEPETRSVGGVVEDVVFHRAARVPE